MQIIYTDVLVIGGGLAGQRAAIGAKRRGHDAIVLSLVPAKRSPLGGGPGRHAGQPGQLPGGAGDNEDITFCRHRARQRLGRRPGGGAHVRPHRAQGDTRTGRLGCPGTGSSGASARLPSMAAEKTIAEPDAAHGLITSRNFGGTEVAPRLLRVRRHRHAMLYTMSNQAIAAGIPVHERMEALALIHDSGRCHGAIVRNLMTGELLAYVARATCIATGGFGRIYRVSTNAVINEGMGAAIALEPAWRPWAIWRPSSFTPPAFSRRHPGHRGLSR